MGMHRSIEQALERHANLRALLEKYPSQAPSVCQTLLDLTHASKWQDIQLYDMQAADVSDARHENDLILLYGLRPEAKVAEAVWCCSIADVLQTARFKLVFDCLDSMKANDVGIGSEGVRLHTDRFLLAVHAPDATIVYYNIARGLVKPVN